MDMLKQLFRVLAIQRTGRRIVIECLAAYSLALYASSYCTSRRRRWTIHHRTPAMGLPFCAFVYLPPLRRRGHIPTAAPTALPDPMRQYGNTFLRRWDIVQLDVNSNPSGRAVCKLLESDCRIARDSSDVTHSFTHGHLETFQWTA